MENHFYQPYDFERYTESQNLSKDLRSAFQIDRDRIIHSSTFRKMQSKTQVFWSGEYDFYRTRLTHSLEVAQIGRSICHWLKYTPDSLLPKNHFIDESLVEAICLSHDMGHPPLGHAGERSLNVWMADYGGFEGNAQTVRLLSERIFSESNKGMNPSRAFLDGVMKYKKIWKDVCLASKRPPKNHFLYDEQKKLLHWVGGTVATTPSLECQIMDWADDTAYGLNDLADSIQAGFLHPKNIVHWAKKTEVNLDKGSSIDLLLKAIDENRVESFIAKRIGDYIQATSLQKTPHHPLASQSNRYAYQLNIAPAIKAESCLYKKLAFDCVFLTTELKQLEYKGHYMLKKLWQLFSQCYLAPEADIDGLDFSLLDEKRAIEIKRASSTAQKARLLCDFFASLTDSSLSRLYKRLFVADSGSIVDLLG